MAKTDQKGLIERVREAGGRGLRKVSKRARKRAVKGAVNGGLKAVRRAGAIGAAIDGGMGLIAGGVKYVRGEATGKEVALHTVREAGRGGLCGVVGTAAAVGLASVVAAPAVAVGSVGLLASWGVAAIYDRHVPRVFEDG